MHKVYISKKSIGESLCIVDAAISSSATSIRLHFITTIVDLFRDTCETSLNSFFLDMIKFSSRDTAGYTLNLNNHLSANIVQLKVVKNIIEETDDVTSQIEIESLPHLNLIWKLFDLNRDFSRKLYIGHLINRNFLQVIINILSRLNDYLTFYVISNNTNSQNITKTTLEKSQLLNTQYQMKESLLDVSHLDSLTELIELAMSILEINYTHLIRVRQEKFKDIKNLNTLFRSYALFNFIFQQAYSVQCQTLREAMKKCIKSDVKNKFKLSRERTQLVKLHDRLVLINSHMMGIFSVFFSKTFESSALTRNFLSELIRFTLDIPFNYQYGLSILSQILPLPLPIPCSVIVFNDDKLQLSDRAYFAHLLESSDLFKTHERKSQTGSNDAFFDLLIKKRAESTTFNCLLRTLCLVSSKSKLYQLLKRICLQLSDLSSGVCALVLDVYLSNVNECLEEIKLAFGLTQVKSPEVHQSQSKSEEKNGTTGNFFFNE